jgi:hypothetical protein
MEFETVERIEVPVKIAGESYSLREADGETAATWKSARAASIRFVKGEMVGTKGLGDLQAVLLSGCLFRVLEDDKECGVSKKTILKWPEKVSSALYDRAMEISGLSEKGDDLETLREQRSKLDEQIEELEELAKNSEESTEDGSD